MNSIKPLSKEQHQQIQFLLPWYVNGSLEKAELQQLEMHLHSCLQCHKEIIELRHLSKAIKQTSAIGVAADVSFADLQTKIKARQSSGAKLNPLRNSGVSGLIKLRDFFAEIKLSADRFNHILNRSQYNYLAIAASVLVVLSPLTLFIWKSYFITDYYTLSATQSESFNVNKLNVVFTKSITDAAKDELFLQINAKRIEGPNSVGAYTVELENSNDRQQLNTAINYLRKQQTVLLAEPKIQP